MNEISIGEIKRKKKYLSDNSVSVKVGDALSYNSMQAVLLPGGGNAFVHAKDTVDHVPERFDRKTCEPDTVQQSKLVDVHGQHYHKKVRMDAVTQVLPMGFTEAMDILSSGKIRPARGDK